MAKEEIKNEGVATTTPLQELCRVYRYEFNNAIDGAICGRLHAKMHGGECYCNCVDFRALLECEFNAGRYKETAICEECNKPQPLHFYSYEGGQLSSTCRVCKFTHDGRNPKRVSFGDAGDEESKNHDCRKFKDLNDWIGKELTIETKENGEVVGFKSIKITNIVVDGDTGVAVITGNDNQNKTRVENLFVGEIQSLLYDGVSVYCNGRNEKVYKKVIR